MLCETQANLKHSAYIVMCRARAGQNQSVQGECMWHADHRPGVPCFCPPCFDKLFCASTMSMCHELIVVMKALNFSVLDWVAPIVVSTLDLQPETCFAHKQGEPTCLGRTLLHLPALIWTCVANCADVGTCSLTGDPRVQQRRDTGPWVLVVGHT